MPDKTIAEFDPAADLAGDELFAIVQNNLTKRATTDQIRGGALAHQPFLTEATFVDPPTGIASSGPFTPGVGAGWQAIPGTLLTFTLDMAGPVLVLGTFDFAWSLVSTYKGGRLNGGLFIDGNPIPSAGPTFNLTLDGGGPFNVDLAESVLTFPWVLTMAAGTHTLEMAAETTAMETTGQVRETTFLKVIPLNRLAVVAHEALIPIIRRITEDGDYRITEDGDYRIIE